jgi:hypothetical protein
MNEDIFRLVVPSESELRKLMQTSRASAMVETVARSTEAAMSASKGARALELLEKIRAKHSSNQLAEASLLCEQGVRDFPTFRDKYGHMVFMKESVRLSLARGDLEEARRAAGILRDGLPSIDPCVHVLFHRHYSRIGDIDAARREAELCLQRDPENEEALAWLAARDTDATSG